MKLREIGANFILFVIFSSSFVGATGKKRWVEEAGKEIVKSPFSVQGSTRKCLDHAQNCDDFKECCDRLCGPLTLGGAAVIAGPYSCSSFFNQVSERSSCHCEKHRPDHAREFRNNFINVFYGACVFLLFLCAYPIGVQLRKKYGCCDGEIRIQEEEERIAMV